jgi:hypothetical protein
MPLKNYLIRCYRKNCPHEAVYKIASRWSDGVTRELKTYFLCCDECLPECFREARRKQVVCRLAPDETLEPPGIYLIQRGAHDYELQRLADREAELLIR